MTRRSGDPVIRCASLVKSFGQTRALDGLDLVVERGEVHGFLGPNGAGKTVTMRILLGLLRADDGDVQLFGGDPWHDAMQLHRRLAYVPGDTTLWPNLTGGEILDVLGGIRGGLRYRTRAALVDRFDLDVRKTARTYSKGNRTKVALIAALASDAELLILDEPTSGLDPLMEAVFQDCILDAKAEGRTVLLSSHILAEVERLCDRVTIIRQGTVVQTGTLSDLRHLTRTSVTAKVRQDPTGLADLGILHDFEVDDRRVSFDVDEADLDEAIRRVSALGVMSLTSHPPTLEALFLRHYGDQLAAPGPTGRATDDEQVG